MDQALVRELVEQRVWAIIGASTNRTKYGHRVFRVLTDSGYVAYPVNPNHDEIDGARCYPTVGDLPEQPGAVCLVVPPRVGLDIVRQCAAAGIERLWFQPGAESAENLALARDLGLKVVAHACVMVLRKRRWD